MASGGRRTGSPKARARQAAERSARTSRSTRPPRPAQPAGPAKPSRPEKPAPVGADGEYRYPGNRLGLPETGVGAVAPWGLRVLALVIDWLIAASIAALIMRRPLLTRDSDQGLLQLVVFFVMSTLLVGTLGTSIGHRICRIRVQHPSGARLGLWRGAVRSALVCLLIPPLVTDRERRGLQDKAVDSVVVRTH